MNLFRKSFFLHLSIFGTATENIIFNIRHVIDDFCGLTGKEFLGWKETVHGFLPLKYHENTMKVCEKYEIIPGCAGNCSRILFNALNKFMNTFMHSSQF
jgi:hypothetical protein